MNYLFEEGQGIILVLTMVMKAASLSETPMDEGLLGKCICHVSRQPPPKAYIEMHRAHSLESSNSTSEFCWRIASWL